MTGAGAGPIVELRGTARSFGSLVAVTDLSFSVRRGEMFGIIGPDGAGKTTTLRMILGLLRPGAGSVRSCGLEPARQRRKLSQKVGYLSQRFSLYGDLTVDENISFFADIHGVRDHRERRDELLRMVRMEPFGGRLAAALSGGMKQKLALACTLIHRPELLVLDEPTTGVDPVSRRDFWRLLARIQRDGITIVLTTPYLDEAERCQRVALMDRGRLLEVDAPDAIRGRAEGSLAEVIARPRARAATLLRAEPGVGDVEVFGERFHVRLPAVPAAAVGGWIEEAAARLRAQGVEVDAARAVTPSLEDVFIARLRGAEQGVTEEVA